MVQSSEGPLIRLATTSDAEVLASGNIDMALETENVRLDSDIVRPGVEAVLTDASKGQYYVVEVAGIVVAQLLITFEWSDWRNSQYWWIQSVFVSEAYRRQGHFRRLYTYIKDQARKQGAAGVRLYADLQNDRANTTYESLGMTSHYKVYEELFC